LQVVVEADGLVVDDGTDLETVSERLHLLAIGRGEASRERRRGMAAGSGKSRGRHMPLGFQGGDTVAGPRAGGPRVGPGEGGGRVGPRRIVEGWHWAAYGRAQEGGCGHLLARPSAVRLLLGPGRGGQGNGPGA